MSGRPPDCPRTIDPALLTRAPLHLGTSGSKASTSTDESSLVRTIRSDPPRTRRPPRLPRISSDCDLEDELQAFLQVSSKTLHRTRRDFDGLPGAHNPRLDRRIAAHKRYFKSQTEGGGQLHIQADPEIGEDAEIVVDAANFSIYDAYLLSVDVAKNRNSFQRLRVIFSPLSGKYTVTCREGRVGLRGRLSFMREYRDLDIAVKYFRAKFRGETGVAWEDRYRTYTDERSRQAGWWRWQRRSASFMFVELDYRKAPLGGPDPPIHCHADTSVPDEVKGLMEFMLYGKRVAEGETCHPPPDVFSAPQNQLSAWAVFRAFRTLERIWGYVESGRPIQWKTILYASSLYRSLIPYPSGENTPPIISNHHMVFIELRFLHSLWPWRGLSDLLQKVYLYGSLQSDASWFIARPLYHAYTSLPHGFRRLEDPRTTEFKRLKAYLENSNQPTHFLPMQLQEIYRVFVKSRAPNPYRDWIESNRSAERDWCDEERLLLWHGTPLDSLFGILDLGLQIKRKGSSITGSMFGNGIYLADVSSKAAGYCRHRQSGGEAVLLLCEADVGSHRIESNVSMEDAHERAARCWGIWRCVQGLGRTGPKGWFAVDWPLGGEPEGGEVLMPDTSRLYEKTEYESTCLAYNEYVVYNPSHVLIRYVFRLKIG